MNSTEARPKEPVPLVIDDRERCEELLALLGDSGTFDIEIRRLAAGDYLLNNRILIERKTVPDLIKSIKSGLLFDQALRLAANERLTPILLLEGSRRQGSRMRWASIQGALVTLSIFIGVPVLWTRNPEDTAAALCSAGRQARAVTNGALKRHGWRPKGKRALQNFILQGLPGVGPDRACRLIDRFGSVRAALSAQPKDLREVHGIGVKTADKIDWAVNEPSPARSCVAQLEVLEPEIVWRALNDYRKSNIDLPDHLLARVNEAHRRAPTVTFDREAAKDALFEFLK